MTISTVYDALPKLKPFKPDNPPDINGLTLTLIHHDPSDGTYVYSNEFYSFTWYNSVVSANDITIYTDSAKGLFRLDYIHATKNPPQTGLSKTCIDIKPICGTLHERDLLHDNCVERMILIKTLLDLNDIMVDQYKLRIIDPDTEAAYRQALQKKFDNRR